MDDDNFIIDEELSSSEEELRDQRIHKQLKIFWIIMIGLKAATTLPSLILDGYDTMLLIFTVIPVVSFYTIVVQKKQRFIAWGLLYLIIASFQTLMVLIREGYSFGENISISLVYGIPMILMLILFGYQVWGVILHAKYRLE